MDNSNMTTVSQVLEKLRAEGNDNEFRIAENGKGFVSSTNRKFYTIDDLEIIRTYRFEGDSNPSDSAIIYLLQANDGHVGYIMDAFGAYSDYDGEQFDKAIRKLPVAERKEK